MNKMTLSLLLYTDLCFTLIGEQRSYPSLIWVHSSNKKVQLKSCFKKTRQILAVKYWKSNIGSQILEVKYRPSNIGSQILEVKYWPSNIGKQKLFPKQTEAKLAVTFPFVSAPLEKGLHTRQCGFKRTGKSAASYLLEQRFGMCLKPGALLEKKQTVSTGSSAVLFIPFYFPAHSTEKQA